MACPRALVLLVLLAACPVLSLGREISEENAKATTDERSSGARMLAVRKRSPFSFVVPCTQTGSRYNCTFCNDDLIIYKGVRLQLGDGQVFNASTTSNRKNINKQGNLDATLYPGDCVKFSFVSTGPVTFTFLDFYKCAFSGYTAGAISINDGTPGNATLVLGLCYPAVQIFNPSGKAPISCQVSCRPYNFYATVKDPVFPCNSRGWPSVIDLPVLPIYLTSGQLTVLESTPGFCKLRRTLDFGEGAPYGYTYYLVEESSPPPPTT